MATKKTKDETQELEQPIPLDQSGITPVPGTPPTPTPKKKYQCYDHTTGMVIESDQPCH